MDEREVVEILVSIKSPPGYFDSVLARNEDWIASLSYNFESERWNTFIPVARDTEDSMEVPSKLKELSGFVGRGPCILGESEWIEEVAEKLPYNDFEEVFEMTYLVPDSLPPKEDLPDLEFRKVEGADAKEDFMNVFTNAFGEEDEKGEIRVEENMEKGIKALIQNDWICTTQEFYVGYKDGKAVTTGSYTIRNGKAFLYNVATHRKHRGRKFGTATSKKIIEEASKHDTEEIYIATQPGTKVEKFYKNMGCQEIFKTKTMKSKKLIEEIKSK